MRLSTASAVRRTALTLTSAALVLGLGGCGSLDRTPDEPTLASAVLAPLTLPESSDVEPALTVVADRFVEVADQSRTKREEEARIAAEKAAAERAAIEKAEAERIAAERAVSEKAEAERIAAERAAAARAAEKAAAEKAEAERVAVELAEVAAAEKAEAEEAAAERAAAEKAEAERVAAERSEAEEAATRSAPIATSSSGGAGGVWEQLRECESGGNYAINTGNGYYGAYQFSPGTWSSLGFSGLPHEASPETQDAAAAKLQERSGWGQWPACSRKLGLR